MSGDPKVDEYKRYFDRYNADYGPNVAVVMQEGGRYVIYGYEDDDESENWTNFWDVRKLLGLRWESISLEHGICQKASFDLSSWPDKCQTLLHDHKFFTVEYVEDDEGNRLFGRILTPGTQVHNVEARGNFLTAIFIDRLHPTEPITNVSDMKLRLGIAAIDNSTGESFVAEILSLEDEPMCPIYDAYQFLLAHPTKEVVIICDMPKLPEEYQAEIETHLNQSLSLDKYARRKIRFQYPSNEKDPPYQNLTLHNAYFAEENSGTPGTIRRLGLTNYPLGLNALIVALNAVEACDPHAIGSLPPPHIWDSGSHLMLTYNSAEQLHLCTDTNKRTDSVLNLIDRTQTPMGRRLLETWLLHPIVEAEEINTRLDAVQCFHTAGKEKLMEYRSYLRDVSCDTVRVIRNPISMTPKKLATLYRTLIHMDPIFQWPIQCLPDGESIFAKWLPDESTCEAIFAVRRTIEETFDIIKLGKAQLKNKNVDQLCFFKSGYDDFIDNAIEQLKTIKSDAKNLAKKLTRLLGSEVTWLESKKGDFCFKLTTQCEEMVRWYVNQCRKNSDTPIRRWNNYAHFNDKNRKQNPKNPEFKAVVKNGQYRKAPQEIHQFLEKEDIELFCDLKWASMSRRSKTFAINFDHCKSWWYAIDEVSHDIRRAVGSALERFIKDHIVPNRNAIMDVSHKVAALDCLYSHAATALQYCYHRPHVDGGSDHSYVSSDGVRHPIVEIINQKECYYANPVHLDQSGILSFGPNNSGKSTFNKSIGINIVLAQSGSFVAAKNFRLAPFKKLMTRLTNQDNMHAGQGTFAVQITELEDALIRGDKYTLVLGDEPCSGTEGPSAVSLVGSSTIDLAKRGINFIFATHYHDLGENEVFQELQQLPNVKFQNFEVQIDRSTNSIRYYRKAIPGVGETEYGLEVASTSRIPHRVIKDAFKMRKRLKGEPEGIASNERSRYNGSVIIDRCEYPGCNRRVDLTIHHLREQREADENGFIDGSFHKNTAGNLQVLCWEHHIPMSTHEERMTRKVATGTGNAVNDVIKEPPTLSRRKRRKRKRERNQSELLDFFGPKKKSTKE